MTMDVSDPLAERVAAAEARLSAMAPGYVNRVRQAAGRLEPRDALGTDARATLVTVDELSVLDLDAPTTSQTRTAQLIKTAVKRLVSWYLAYIGQQLSGFGRVIGHLAAILLDRTERLEHGVADLEARVARLSERVDRLEQGGTGQG